MAPAYRARFGELHAPDILLVDRDLLVQGGLFAPGDHELRLAVLQAEARRVEVRPETAALVDDPRPVEFGHPVDDPGAADPLGAGDGGLGPPALLADDLEGNLERSGIDPDPLDRPGGRPHAEADVRPLEGGTGGAGCGDELRLVSHDQFAVRPHVDDEDHLLAAVGLLRDQDPHVVRPDETRLDREQMDVGARMDRQAEVARLDVERAVDRPG